MLFTQRSIKRTSARFEKTERRDPSHPVIRSVWSAEFASAHLREFGPGRPQTPAPNLAVGDYVLDDWKDAPEEDGALGRLYGPTLVPTA